MKNVVKHLKFLLFVSLFLSILTIGALWYFFVKYHGRIYPNISVSGVYVGGLTMVEAKSKIGKAFIIPENIELVYLSDGEKKFMLNTAEIEFKYDYNDALENAYKTGRSSRIFRDIYTVINAFKKPVGYEIGLIYNSKLLKERLSAISAQISEEPAYPSAELISGNVVINKGLPGYELDIAEVERLIVSKTKSGDFSPVFLVPKLIDPSLDELSASLFKARVEKMLTKSVVSKHESMEFKYEGANFLPFLNPSGGYFTDKIDDELEKIIDKVNRPAQNPTFVFNEGRVEEFTPAKEGVVVIQDDFKNAFVGALKKVESEDISAVQIDIPVLKTDPEFKTEDVNNLGIKELIGRGSSRFRGSITSRVHNINLAASKLNGLLIRPGDVFSFNSALGDVSKFTGYKEAYVIKDGKTVLGDGGGVCQVSTTLFRAALNAGLPIIERRAHSYRVGYYEQDSGPGLDATVYDPTTDLKIKNDTPGHILIQASADVTNYSLVFELYGTSDGRIAEVSKPDITDSTPPPEDLYVDEPTLPQGEVKQIEFKAWGARVNFDYTVTRGEEIIFEKTFYSNYKPWQAVFLRGTGPN